MQWVNTAGIQSRKAYFPPSLQALYSRVLDEITETQTKGSGNSSQVSGPKPTLSSVHFQILKDDGGNYNALNTCMIPFIELYENGRILERED